MVKICGFMQLSNRKPEKL